MSIQNELLATSEYLQERFICYWTIKTAHNLIRSSGFRNITSSDFKSNSKLTGIFEWQFVYDSKRNSEGDLMCSMYIETKKTNLNSKFSKIACGFTAVLSLQNGDILYEDDSMLQEIKITDATDELYGKICFRDFLFHDEVFGDDGYVGKEGVGTLKLKLIITLAGTLNLRSEVIGSSEIVPLTDWRNEPKDSFFQKISQGFLNGDFTDLEVKTTTEGIKCHKFILSAYSSVFREIFTTGTVESNMIEILDFDNQTVKGMISFMYNVKIGDEENNFFNLLKIAHKYQFVELKELCEIKLSNDVNVGNFAELLECAHFYDSNLIKTKVLDFVKSNKNELKKNEDFERIVKTYPEFLLQLYYGEE